MGMDRMKKKSRFPLKWVLGISIPLAFIGVFAYQVLYVDKAPVVFAKTADLKIARVVQGEFQEYVNVQSLVIPGGTMYVDAGEAGIVEEVYVKQGSIVIQGMELVQLSNHELELELLAQKTRLTQQQYELEDVGLAIEQQKNRIKSELLNLDFQLRQNEDELLRKKELFAQQIISASEFERAQQEYAFWQTRKTMLLESNATDLNVLAQKRKKIEAGMQLLQTELEGLQYRMGNLRIAAPAMGQLTILNAFPGETKYRGARIAQIDLITTYKIQATVDEYYLSQIAVGRKGTFTGIDQETGLERTYDVRVSRVSPDVQNKGFEIECDFEGTKPKGIRSGQSFVLRLELGETKDALMLPRGPFVQTTGGSWAYVLDNGGSTAARRAIRIGKNNPDYLEILEGLTVGEDVIISRYDDYNNVEQIVLNE
jgi:HlyD family secretion protein